VSVHTVCVTGLSETERCAQWEGCLCAFCASVQTGDDCCTSRGFPALSFTVIEM
jgi:hypothetical protein